MENINKNRFFLLISPNFIKFSALNLENKILYQIDTKCNDKSLNESYTSLEKFLEKNIIDLEKKFNFYIEDINLIIDLDDFISIDISTIHNFNYLNEKKNGSSNYLVNIKDNVVKTMNNHSLIHMMINKFIIDGKEYNSVPNKIEKQNIYLEIKFLFLKNDIIHNLKKVFSKYEISVKDILNFNYVCSFISSMSENVFELASKLKDGLNHKEILFLKKPIKNNGFFERFFNFFR